MTILITREKLPALDMAASVAARGGNPFIFSTIETRIAVTEQEKETFLKELSLSTWVILTSANGGRFFLHLLGDSYRSLLSSKKIAAVGRKTASYLEMRGIGVDCVPETEDSRSLGEALIKKLDGEDVVFFPRAKMGRRDAIDILMGEGIGLYAPVLYETVVPKYDREEIEDVLQIRGGYATFTSPSTFRNFIELAGKDSASAFFKNVKIAVIGETTANCVEECSYHVSVLPDYPDTERLLDAITADITDASLKEEG